MNLSHRIQAKTDNGDLVIDFLVEVMQSLPRTRYGDERPDFKICHRLDAAKLLTKYGRDEAIDFILDNPREPSRSRKSSGPSEESEFDIALAKKIRESTDDGVSVVRFLINVMEGELKVFGPQHRMAAARELLSRGFGKHAREESARMSSSHRRSGEAGTQRRQGWEALTPHSSKAGIHSLLSPFPFRRVPGRHRDSRPRP